MAHLRIGTSAPVTPTPEAFTYTNRMGALYYLHEGRTKTGKPRYYVAKTIGAGALATVPSGFEMTESVNGVVSVRRSKPGQEDVPVEDLRLVEAAITKHPHLSGYMARILGSSVVIFEPDVPADRLRDVIVRSSLLGDVETYVDAKVKERLAQGRFAAVMKFERDGADYVLRRMTYRGKGGWSWGLKSGSLPDLTKKYVASLGTESFYDLM